MSVAAQPDPVHDAIIGRLAAIVENCEDAIVGKDLNGIITSWNIGAERLFGYTADEIIGKPVSTLAAPDRLDEMPTILERLRQGQRIEHLETRRRTKDGRIIDVSLTISPVRDASGRIIGASKIARDITARKRAETERALLFLREQEARKTAELLNRVGRMLLAELDINKLVQSVTNVATELVGAESGCFIPNAIDQKRDIGTQSGASLQVPVTSRSGELLGNLVFTHSEPGRFTHQHEAILTGIAAQAAIAIDNARLFEEAQWIQNELKRSNEELRRANQDLETFAYSASHDLQEPLRTIGISAQLLEQRYGEQIPDEAREFLSEIYRGTQRMGNLIRDLLSYATVTRCAEGPPPRIESSKVLHVVLENLKARIEETSATITTDPLPIVSVHENRLALLFQNLISNALKYRKEQAPRVHISAVERDGWAVFSVADNGIGIDPKFTTQIFGAFKRLHNREKYPGNGIGLAICERIAEQYGGRIWLEQSEPGKGSTFCFSFPRSSALA